VPVKIKRQQLLPPQLKHREKSQTYENNNNSGTNNDSGGQNRGIVKHDSDFNSHVSGSLDSYCLSSLLSGHEINHLQATTHSFGNPYLCHSHLTDQGKNYC
jgi:hypothetical protein